MSWTAVCFVVLFCVFAIGLSVSINRDTYTGNGKLDKYEWEKEND